MFTDEEETRGINFHLNFWSHLLFLFFLKKEERYMSDGQYKNSCLSSQTKKM